MRLIDADELDDVVIDLNQKGWAITRNEYKRIDGILFEFPTADPVKHGRWITSNYVTNYGTKSQTKVYTECKCSVCGGMFGRMSDLFCYRCGARMDGENDE